MRKVSFLVGFGAGYVLGAKAGHERYEQLRRLYENLNSSPGVRRATGRARDVVGSGLEQAKEKASEGVSKVQEVVKERRGAEGHPSGLTVAPPPS